MNKVVALLFVLSGSVVERSDGVSCYDCQYYSNSPGASTCTEPFNPARTSTCNGDTCLFTYVNVGGGGGVQPYYTVLRSCANVATYLVDFCLSYKLAGSSFFVSGSSCCYKVAATTQYGATEVISCFCQQNNCNGDLPHEAPGNQPSATTRKTSNSGIQPSATTRKTSNSGIQPSATTRKTSNSGYQPSDTRNKALNSGFAVKPFNYLSKAAFAIITVLSTSLLSNYYI